MAYMRKATPRMQKTATPRKSSAVTGKIGAPMGSGSLRKVKRANPSTPNVGGGSGVSSRTKRKIY